MKVYSFCCGDAHWTIKPFPATIRTRKNSQKKREWGQGLISTVCIQKKGRNPVKKEFLGASPSEDSVQAAVDQAIQADTRLRCLYGEFPVHFRRRPQEDLAGMPPFS